MRRHLIALVLSLALVPAAHADVLLPTGPDLNADGWKVVGFLGVYQSVFVGHGAQGIEVVAEDSNALLLRELPVTGEAGMMLRWSWRLDRAPPPTDLATGAGDRPLAVHVWFPDPADRPGNLGEELARAILGLPREGRVLSYVWGGRDPERRSFPSPFSDAGVDGVAVVLRPGNGPTGEWFEETVDLYADFQATFGEEPPLPSYLALSADADDAGGRSEGWIKGLRFSYK